MKQAILLVSFGTTHLEQLERSIESGVRYIDSCFEEIEVKLAFSSKVVIKKLKEVHNKEVLFIDDAIENFINDGYEQLFIQPLHLIEGKEYHKVLDVAGPYSTQINIKVGKPLFSSQEAIKQIINEVICPYKQDEEMVLLLGHGTDHEAHKTYREIEWEVEKVYPYSAVSTLENLQDVEWIVAKMKEHNKSKIVIVPIMLVAGKHVEIDVKGTEEDKWEGRFRRLGIDVIIVEKGLGEYPGTYRMFESHIREYDKVKSQ